MYAIVVSDALDIYVGTKGDLGYALSKHETLAEAREAAREVADDYIYGVEIVDEAEWTVVE